MKYRQAILHEVKKWCYKAPQKEKRPSPEIAINYEMDKELPAD